MVFERAEFGKCFTILVHTGHLEVAMSISLHGETALACCEYVRVTERQSYTYKHGLPTIAMRPYHLIPFPRNYCVNLSDANDPNSSTSHPLTAQPAVEEV